MISQSCAPGACLPREGGDPSLIMYNGNAEHGSPPSRGRPQQSLCFVFCHGFGFDATFWNPLRPYFSSMNAVYLDLGYFGDGDQSAFIAIDGVEYIGIGHSLGLRKLMSLNVSFKGLIGLHGFVNFLGFNEQLHRRRLRELKHLTQQFSDSAELTLGQFYQRTGVDFNLPKTGFLNRIKLLEDLSLLIHSAPVAEDIPMLVLGSSDDKIVPPSLIEDNFSSCPHVTIDIINQAQHGLGYLKPDVVHQKIMRFLEF